MGFGSIIGVLLILGFIAFITYEIVGIVRYFIERKKSKICDKGDDTE